MFFIKETLENYRDLINNIKENTYNLSKENELLILSLLEKEISKKSCNPIDNCAFRKVIDSKDNNFIIHCSYLETYYKRSIYTRDEEDLLWGCPYLELIKDIKTLKLR